MVDLENLVFYDYYCMWNVELICDCGSKIEGIGCLRVELSFIFDVVDEMCVIFDVVSVVIIYWLEKIFGCKVGVFIGINLYGVL